MANKIHARDRRRIITCGKIDQTQTKDKPLWPFKNANGGTITADTLTEVEYKHFNYNKNTDELACDTFFEVGGFGSDAVSISSYVPTFYETPTLTNVSSVSIITNFGDRFIDDDGQWVPVGSYLPVMYRYRYGDNDALYLQRCQNPRITVSLGRDNRLL